MKTNSVYQVVLRRDPVLDGDVTTVVFRRRDSETDQVRERSYYTVDCVRLSDLVTVVNYNAEWIGALPSGWLAQFEA